jgi:serine/threonine protein kinase
MLTHGGDTVYHAHIVGVHDRGEYNGQLWILMDYVDGLDAAGASLLVARLVLERDP